MSCLQQLNLLPFGNVGFIANRTLFRVTFYRGNCNKEGIIDDGGQTGDLPSGWSAMSDIAVMISSYPR